MAALIFVILLIALVIWGLNHNHRRQAPPRLSGSSEPENRDEARVRAEVAARRVEPVAAASAVPAGPRVRHHLSRA